MKSLPVVGVLGSGRNTHADRAEPLGRWLARRGMHLLTGGGQGVMASVSEAFHETRPRDGLVLGVLPGDPSTGEPPVGYPNRWVEIAIATHLPWSGSRGTDTQSRNHINVLSADVLVALPGSAGTASEVELADRYGRPLVAFLTDRAEIPYDREPLHVCSTIEGVTGFVDARLEELSAG